MKCQATRELDSVSLFRWRIQFNYSRNGASIEQRPRHYRFRFADVFFPAGRFAETFLVADFVRVPAAGFRFGFGFV
jgi:hypothetical protein